MSSKPFKLGIVGGGPRGTTASVYIALKLLAEPGLKDCGIEITVFDKEDDDNIAGGGHAWQVDCDGAANTGVPPLPRVRGFQDLAPELQHLLDLPARVAEKAVAEKDVILNKLAERSPPSATLFRKAFRPDGSFDTSRACCTRGFLGTVLKDCITKILHYIRDNVPQIVIDIRPKHEVVDCDVSVPEKPRLIVRKVGGTQKEEFTFDHVVLAQGAVLKPAVGPTLSPKTYSGVANFDNFKAFLATHDMLNEHGKLKPGMRVAITGESLSALDCLGVVLGFVPCFVLDSQSPVGYYVDEELATQYQGAITFISRTGHPAAPRLSHSPEWPAGPALLTTRQMKALRLGSDPNLNWIAVALELHRFNAAYALKKAPEDVFRQLRSSRAYMDYYLPQVDEHLANPSALTELGLERNGKFAIFCGLGFEANPKRALDRLAATSPYICDGLNIWHWVQSAGYRPSRGEYKDTLDNKIFFELRDEVRFVAASSPVFIQHSANLLFQSGVAVHEPGDFKNLVLRDDGVALGDVQFNVLFAPKVISRDADALFRLLEKSIKMADGGPVYRKGRGLQTPEGVPINVTEVGLGGWGVRLADPLSIGSVSGESASGEILDLDAAFKWADTFSRQFIIELLIRTYISGATIDDFYKKVLPSEIAFREEVETFKQDWDDLRKVYYCAVLARAKAGGDAVKFQKYAKTILEDGCVKFIEGFKNDTEAGFSYETILTEYNNEPTMGEFRGVSLEEFDRSFLDYSDTNLAAIYNLVVDAKSKVLPGMPPFF